MTKIKTVSDFLAADHPDFFVDALRINDEFENTNNAEIAQEMIKALNQSVHQVEEYIKLFPQKAEDTIHVHNNEITRMMTLLMRDCGLNICYICRKLFLPEHKNHHYCQGCFDAASSAQSAKSTEKKNAR